MVRNRQLIELCKALGILTWLCTVSAGILLGPPDWGQYREMLSYSFIIPILLAGAFYGYAGCLLTALVSSLICGVPLVGKPEILQSADAQRLMFQIIYFNVVAITTGALAERAKTLQNRYKGLFEDVPVGVFRLTPIGQFIEVNRRMVQMLGFPDRDALLQIRAEQLFADPSAYQPLVKRIAEGEEAENYETRFRRNDGTEIWGQINLRIVRAEDGAVLYHEGSLTDTTLRKAAEERLQSINAELEERVMLRTQDLTAANEEMQAIIQELQETNERLRITQAQLVQSEKMVALGSLVVGIAHEINTPTGNAITATTHIEAIAGRMREHFQTGNLKKQDLEGFLVDLDTALTITMSNLNRAVHLINSFKQVSVDQTSEICRPFNVKEYLEELLVSLRHKLVNSGHTVTIQCDEEIEVDSYPGAIAQIISHLLMNSLVHAYNEGVTGHISIDCKYENQHLFLVYSDDGKGMEPSIQARIFDPFFTTHREIGGTGLGLYIVYNIVTMKLGGSIECHTALGQGTAFAIRFPAAAGSRK
ncbi:MAG: ATP-binding protein [Solirubrobacterales bacterium]